MTLILWASLGFSGLLDYPSSLDKLQTAQAPSSYTIRALFDDLHAPLLGRLVWYALVIGVVAWCVVAGRRGDDRRSFALAVLLAVIASPIVWLHSFLLLLAPVAVYRPRLSVAWLLPPCSGSARGRGTGRRGRRRSFSSSRARPSCSQRSATLRAPGRASADVRSGACRCAAVRRRCARGRGGRARRARRRGRRRRPSTGRARTAPHPFSRRMDEGAVRPHGDLRRRQPLLVVGVVAEAEKPPDRVVEGRGHHQGEVVGIRSRSLRALVPEHRDRLARRHGVVDPRPPTPG